ncbi:hypothetical protein Z968_06275 [Clostridium novyi A str. 4552]|uniref:Sporulation protein n=1 Tax=Clostridium novyi A str. 4552 TaxID=1444289 RepID=A0A0A0I7E4_CLONO|nr:hypothetical protein Z968_06275 [Clostridium novyi A str. 4552]
MNLKKGIIAVVSALVLSLSMIGCTTSDTTKDNKNTTNETTKQEVKKDTNGMTNGMNKTEDYSSERVKKIEDAVNKIKEVKSSAVVITGDRALVGINLQPNVEDAKTKQVKSEVEKIAKSTDKNLKSVAVSSDVDIFTRISKVGEGLKSGKPFSEFTKEVEEIFRRVLPQ